MKHEFNCKFKGMLWSLLLAESKKREVSITRVVKDCVRSKLSCSGYYK